MITKPRWEVQNALVFIDLSKSTVLLWQTSRKFDDILAKQEKAHWTFKNVLISDDLVTAHRRSKSEQWRDEFETVTLDLMRPKLIKTVSMQKWIQSKSKQKDPPHQELKNVDNTKNRSIFKTAFEANKLANNPDPGLDIWFFTKKHSVFELVF